MTNSPHVPFFRPLIGLLEERGHDVRVSARDFAQTLELLETRGHRRTTSSARRTAAPAAPGRSARWARACGRCARGPRPQRFDLALSHASHELPLAARSLRVPSSYAYDYEFARAQHTLGSRAATRVVVPDAIPQERLDRLGARPRKVRRYPGLKEEYYLAGFSPDRGCAGRARPRPGARPRRRAHPARGLALPPPRQPALRRRARAARPRRGVQAVVLPRTPAQRTRSATAALPSLVVPEHAIDAQSLIALADLVVSAGGTMNREAVALGTPVWTTFAGQAGGGRRGADRGRAAARADGRRRARAREEGGRRRARRRDPELMLDLLLSALETVQARDGG